MSADLLIATGQVFLTLGALLMLLNEKTVIHPVLAGLTTVSLGLVSLGLFMLSAPVSGIIAGVALGAWAGILVFRSGRPKV